MLITGSGFGPSTASRAGDRQVALELPVLPGAINCSPVVDGTLVYANHGEESPGTNIQGRVLCVDAGDIKDGKPKLVWQKDGVKAKYTTPIVHAGRIYVCDDIAKMWCFDSKKGDMLWKFAYGRNAMGSAVWGDGKIYVGEINARFHILKPGDKKCEELHVHDFPSPDGRRTRRSTARRPWPMVRFIFRRATSFLHRYQECQAGDGPPPAEAKKGKPAQLLIYPCDVVTIRAAKCR